MRIYVRINPNSKVEKVEELGNNHYVARVKAPPQENKANQDLIRVFARHFKIAKSRISIHSGLKGRVKVLQIR